MHWRSFMEKAGTLVAKTMEQIKENAERTIGLAP